MRSVRASRIGVGSCSDRSCTSRVSPAALTRKTHVQHRRATATRSRCASTARAAAEHERHGSSSSIATRDRSTLEALSGTDLRAECVFPARQPLAATPSCPTAPRHQLRQRSEISQRTQPPSFEDNSQFPRLGVGRWKLGIDDKIAKQREREISERCGFITWGDNSDPRTMTNHQSCGGARAGNGDADLQTTIGGRAAQFLGNRACVAEEARQAAQVEQDLAMERFETRRKLCASSNAGRAAVRP